MKVELNKQLDKDIYLEFRKSVVGGVNFGEIIRKDHPEINEENHEEYIENFYKLHQKELQSTRLDTAGCYGEIKEVLKTNLKKYFGREFHDENCVCYLSIFNCNPRFLESQSFQVYYKRPRNLRNEVLVHELTHFAFYDFCRAIGLEDDKQLWELSEIFNVIFLNLPGLQKVIGVEEKLFYPDLKEKLADIKKIWNENLPAEKFIKESLKHLKKFPA